MPPPIIDLTSDLESDDDSPDKVARSVLQGFRPRKQKDGVSDANGSLRHDASSPETAARSALQSFLPRKQKVGLNAANDPKKFLRGEHLIAPNSVQREQQVNGLDRRHVVTKERESFKTKVAHGGGLQNGSLASLLQQEVLTGGVNGKQRPQRSSTGQTSPDNITVASIRKNGTRPIQTPRNDDSHTNRIIHRNGPTPVTWNKKSLPKPPLRSEASMHRALPPGVVRLAERNTDQAASVQLDTVPWADDFAGDRPSKRRRISPDDVESVRDGISRKAEQTIKAPKSTAHTSMTSQGPIRPASPLVERSQKTSREQSQARWPSDQNFYSAKSHRGSANGVRDSDHGRFNAAQRKADTKADTTAGSDRPLHGNNLIAGIDDPLRATQRPPAPQIEAQLQQSQGSETRELAAVLLPSPSKKVAESINRVADSVAVQQNVTNTNMPKELPTANGIVAGDRANAQDAQKMLQKLMINGPLQPAAVMEKGDPANANPQNNHGVPYTPAEDALLIKLKEVDKLNWHEIVPHFQGRTYGSIQVRYSSKLKGRTVPNVAASRRATGTTESLLAASELHRVSSPDSLQPAPKRQRKRRGQEASVLNGFVSWADVKKGRLLDETQDDEEIDKGGVTELAQDRQFTTERAYPKPVSRILRQRELGSSAGRSWSASARSVPEELKEHVFDDIGPRKYFKGTSGDVTCVTWAPDGAHFAAGSIAISDARSMQYNRPNNLLLGDYGQGKLQELPEHHISRPSVDADTGNVNGLHSMQQTQDQRLFMTVANVQFSPDAKTLYSAGSDRMVRAYDFDRGINQPSCLYEIEHAASLDLISVSNTGRLATASHQSTDGAISIYDAQQRLLSLSPSGIDRVTDRAIYPSALRWGTAYRHSNFLLAGFSIDSIDEERNMAGETCLWDIAAEQRIELAAITRNVFDVAWNPSPSSTSTLFAVASSSGGNKVGRGMRSVVQCFAPGQNKAKRVLEWECPAFDLNDVTYCPFDDNLIAAGATDGKVFVWDQRFANRSNQPLHILEHGDSLNVLDHDREREIADTGVRFLSWGATSSRLYSGSSDGVVKVWNPYRSTKDAHIKNVATFTSAVMSGAFSPDGQDLLIGEDQGRLNLLSVGYQHVSMRAVRPFDFTPAPAPAQDKEGGLDAAHELVRLRQVELRPMGALPVRQAVQGPQYTGPHLAPSLDETSTAEQQYRKALDEQSETHAQAATATCESGETELAFRKVDKQVQAAQERLLRLQSRLDDSVTLGPQAAANQLRFRKAEKNRLKLEASLPHPVEHCKLDCNYLPAFVDDDGEVPDSRRSEARIPGALHAPQVLDTLDMTSEELAEAGLTAKCMGCFGPAKKPISRKESQPRPTLCDSCSLARKGLTATCEVCSAPIRRSTDFSVSNLCERCNFACFRCARPILLGRKSALISCDHCGITWEAGVLGYEVLASTRSQPRKIEASKREAAANDVISRQHFGNSQIEHYASQWQ